MNKIFVIADIHGNVMSINPHHIEAIVNAESHGDILCNDLCMASGDEYTVPVQMIISMLNSADYTVYDLVTAAKNADLADDDLDVNDTEYVDENGLEETSDEIKVEQYDDGFDDGHSEFGEYITAHDDLPDSDVSVDDIIEGSVANG